MEELDALSKDIEKSLEKITALKEEMAKVIVGQQEMVESILIALLSDGHLLLEGLPGLAKTLTVKTFASAVHFDFQRIQFTPDLLPADLTGTLVFDPKESRFATRKGPVFTNILLADEINRAPAKVQSALLQAMEEREVTIGNRSFALPAPFMVMATENPIEQEGTYPLPEAQSDRFMMKLLVSYPDLTEEKQIVSKDFSSPLKKELGVDNQEVISEMELNEAKGLIQRIYVDDKIIDYAIGLVAATRPAERPPGRRRFDLSQVEFGGSPRASIYLLRAARSHAFFAGRAFVSPQDIRAVIHRVLRHRLILSYEAEAEGITSDHIVDRVLDHVEVP